MSFKSSQSAGLGGSSGGENGKQYNGRSLHFDVVMC
jgi:hypothetical protein